MMGGGRRHGRNGQEQGGRVARARGERRRRERRERRRGPQRARARAGKNVWVARGPAGTPSTTNKQAENKIRILSKEPVVVALGARRVLDAPERCVASISVPC